MAEHRIFEAGEVVLQSGRTLPGAKIAYATHGALDAAGSNVVLCFTPFGARGADCEYFIGEGKAVDPGKYFIVVFNTTGNGLSSSPSNTPPPSDRARFPEITVYDNVQMQHKLLAETFGIEKVALAFGHSMGAIQTYHWAALFPDMVERIAPICGAARTSIHNAAFLDGMRAVLTADPAWRDGDYAVPPTAGLRALGRAWAPWPPSAGFYRAEKYRELGFETLETFLAGYWERWCLSLDANDILSQIWTWRHADISANERYGSRFEDALAAIDARAIVMPSQTDAYFPPEDSEYEAAHMPNAEFRPIPTIWGHWAGSGRNPADTAFIDTALKELLPG